MKHWFGLIAMAVFVWVGCNSNASSDRDSRPKSAKSIVRNQLKFDTLAKTIHVFVALRDNKYQGIVPVPAGIGNGQDQNSNLYWGCTYGIRTYFKRSKDWQLVSLRKLKGVTLERLVFKHVTKDFYLIADAYDGQYIKKCTEDFLKSASGQQKDTIRVNDKAIGLAGNAKLVAYIGHDGLMDFSLPNTFQNADRRVRDCIVLACISKSYFKPYLEAAGANPLLLTTGLMCPEAYTLHSALAGYVNNEPKTMIRNRAVAAYAKYQHCGEKAAKNLLVANW